MERASVEVRSGYELVRRRDRARSGRRLSERRRRCQDPRARALAGRVSIAAPSGDTRGHGLRAEGPRVTRGRGLIQHRRHPPARRRDDFRSRRRLRARRPPLQPDAQDAASILTEEVKGKTLDEVKAIDRDHVLANLGIPISPARIKCALLGLKALKGAAWGLTAWPGEEVKAK